MNRVQRRGFGYPLRVVDGGLAIATDLDLLRQEIVSAVETVQLERVMRPNYGRPLMVFDAIADESLVSEMLLQTCEVSVPDVERFYVQSKLTDAGAALVHIDWQVAGIPQAPIGRALAAGEGFEPIMRRTPAPTPSAPPPLPPTTAPAVNDRQTISVVVDGSKAVWRIAPIARGQRLVEVRATVMEPFDAIAAIGTLDSPGAIAVAPALNLSLKGVAAKVTNYRAMDDTAITLDFATAPTKGRAIVAVDLAL